MSASTNGVARRAAPYRWVVLGLAVATVATANSVRNSFGVLLLPLQAEFGWGQSATVAAFTIHQFAFGLASPFAGGLADRVRPKLFLTVAALTLALGLAVTTAVGELWQFYALYGLVLGAGLAASGFPPHAAIVARWFASQRGVAYAILNTGASLSLIMAGLAQWITLHFGWRAALLGIAALLALAVAPAIVLLQRDLPPLGSATRSRAQTRDEGAAVEAAGTPGASRMSRDTPAHGWAFWCLFAIYVLYSAQQQTLIVYQLPYLVTRGYDPLLAASVLSGVGVANIVGLASSGLPSDKLGREPVITAGVALVVLGLAMLALAGAGVGAVLPLYAVAYGMGLGLISPALSASAADLFAGPRFGFMYGTFNLAGGLGGALAPWLIGRVVEATGLLDLTLALPALCALGPGVLIWIAAPRRRRAAPQSAR